MLQGPHAALLLQTGIWDMVRQGSVYSYTVLGILACFSVVSLAIVLAKWSAFNIIMWGLTLCFLAAVKNFAGAVAVRFFLGVFEAAVTPGFALFTSQW